MYIWLILLFLIYFKNNPFFEITIAFESGSKTYNYLDLVVFLENGYVQIGMAFLLVYFIFDVVRTIPKCYKGYLRLKQDLLKRKEKPKEEKSSIIIIP